MKALPQIVLKELNLIRSQRMTLALIIIYPLLVIGALGLAFGAQTHAQKVDVALFIPSETELGPFSSQEIVKIIEDTNKVRLQLAGSREEAERFVKRGRSDFGLVVREEQTASGQIVADLLLDNSNFIVSGMFSPIAKAAIQITSFEVSSQVIQQLWNELLPVRDDLGEELQKIDLYLADLGEAGEKIDSLQETMQGIDVSSLRSTLSAQEGNVQQTRQVLQQFNSDYAAFKSDIGETRQSLNETETKLNTYHSRVSDQVSLARTYRNELVSYEQEIESIANSPGMPADQRDQLLELKGEVSQTRQRVDESIAELEQVKADIEESQAALASMKQNLNAVEARLDAEKQSLDGMNSTLDSTTGDISAMNAQVASLTQTIDEVNSLIAEARAAKDNVSAKLEDSKGMLQAFMETLGDLSKISPSFLSRPIQAFEKPLYPHIKPITFITPISLGLVLLLTCLLLSSVSVITERKEGAHLRMRLSSTHPVTLVTGKVIGQMLFAFLVSFIILAIGLLAFGVQLRGSFPEIMAVIAVSAFSFIALGLFITNFAKTQATAILGSLILILPMIFLSGAILPLQLMSPALQSISAFLPLTAANNLLLGVLIKGLPLASLLEEVAILVLPAVALLGYTVKKF